MFKIEKGGKEGILVWRIEDLGRVVGERNKLLGEFYRCVSKVGVLFMWDGLYVDEFW